MGLKEVVIFTVYPNGRICYGSSLLTVLWKSPSWLSFSSFSFSFSLPVNCSSLEQTALYSAWRLDMGFIQNH